jgi:hypothetical protein
MVLNVRRSGAEAPGAHRLMDVGEQGGKQKAKDKQNGTPHTSAKVPPLMLPPQPAPRPVAPRCPRTSHSRSVTPAAIAGVVRSVV